MTVDAHQHFWKFDPVRDAWITPDMSAIRRDFLPHHLEPLLKQNNIDACVSVQADQSRTETEFLLDLAGRFDFIAGVVGWVDFFAPDLEDQLRRYSHAKKLKGFRHIVQAEPDGFLSGKKFIEGVKRLRNFDFRFDLLVYHHQLAEAIIFLKETTDIRIVVDHIAKPSIKTGAIDQWKKDMKAVAGFDNVCCKISGMVTEAEWSTWTREQIYPYIDVILEAFGPSRLMYGSDWPVCLVAGSYNDQFGIVNDYLSALSVNERNQILGFSATEFYKL